MDKKDSKSMEIQSFSKAISKVDNLINLSNNIIKNDIDDDTYKWWTDLSHEWKLYFSKCLKKTEVIEKPTKHQVYELFATTYLLESLPPFDYEPNFKTIEPVKLLTNIQEIILIKHDIRDLSPIYSLPELQRLVFSKCFNIDLNTIIKPHGLCEELAFENCNLLDITPLKYFTEVYELDLSYNSIENIECLSNIEYLNILNLEKNNITNIDVLSNIRFLAELNLSKNKVTDISSLKGLKHLDTLFLDSNKILNADSLSSLNLKGLNLSYNQINDISFLRNMTIGSLSLNGNRINDIEPLSNMVYLKRLAISNNNITDIQPLANFNNLDTLHLNGNPIPQDAINELREQLPECDIYF